MVREWNSISIPLPDEDDGFLMPFFPAVESARAVAVQYRDQGLPAPDDVVPNGDGGVFFHWGKPGEVFETLEFFKDGSGTYTSSENLRRLERLPFSSAQLRSNFRG
jgi:hypothetical protein